MEKTRIALLVVAIVAAFGCIGFMGVDALCEKIYKSRDCEFANIDNIEMHAKINIPSTKDCECLYDRATNTKKAFFDLDSESVAKDYIEKNQLVKTDMSQIALAEFGLEKNKPDFTNQRSLYYREGKTKRDNYKIIFDRDAGKIWVKLTYFD